MTKLDKWIEEVNWRIKHKLHLTTLFKSDLPKALRIIERMRGCLEYYREGKSEFDGEPAEDCLKSIEEEI